ncbi:MAG TPA: hypothetical protein VE548_14380 [Nitrososphaeraceae archaeon]|jgi:hypothetical protein|nr:hypothetical protein [Nitrososphaeraceae archaeon]
MKKECLYFKIMLISSIVVLSCFVVSLDTISDSSQVSGETTSLLVPQTTEQSGNKTTLQVFIDSLRGLVSKSNELTSKYQLELGKWTTKENDNSTMIAITDRYLSQFEELENEASDLAVPTGQENIKESFIKSISSEAASYEHFKNYLTTGNRTEDELSIDDLSLAFQYEQVYATFLLKNR